jgi:hypothetical protein
MRAGAIAPAMATVVLASGLVSGCGAGESSTEDYCAALADEKATLQRLSDDSGGSSGDELSQSVAVFERLRDAAPADLRDEWTTYVNAWQGLTDALDAAGADASVFRNGKRPDGVDPGDYDAIRDAATKLASPAVRDASAGIEHHASEVCDVELGGVVG